MALEKAVRRIKFGWMYDETVLSGRIVRRGLARERFAGTYAVPFLFDAPKLILGLAMAAKVA